MYSEYTRIAFVKLFYENGSSFVRAQRAFTVTFEMDIQSDQKTLRRWIRTLESTGSLSNIKPHGRNRSILNEINIATTDRQYIKVAVFT